MPAAVSTAPAAAVALEELPDDSEAALGPARAAVGTTLRTIMARPNSIMPRSSMNNSEATMANSIATTPGRLSTECRRWAGFVMAAIPSRSVHLGEDLGDLERGRAEDHDEDRREDAQQGREQDLHGGLLGHLLGLLLPQLPQHVGVDAQGLDQPGP